MREAFIPIVDPNPLPAPFWVFKLLLVVTFFLHIIAMNFLLGGGSLALLARSRSKDREAGNRLFGDLAKKLPSLVAATVSIGVAPLLFLQVLYGQFFYTSSVIVAWPWFLVLVFLVFAYYGLYYVSLQNWRHPGKASGVMLLSVVLIFLVGFVYSNNMTLSQAPSRWPEKYFANPAGWNLNLSEPTLIPRFLHFFTAAVAVGGLMLVLLAFTKRETDAAYSRHAFRFGGKAFMYATMAQFILGTWFFVALPRDGRMLFMGGNLLATILFMVSFAGAIVSIILMSIFLRKQDVRLAAFSVSGVTGVVILSMVVMRDLLRDAYLKPYFHPAQFVVKTQWSVLPLFLVLFLGGVALWLVMLKRYGLFETGTREQI